MTWHWRPDPETDRIDIWTHGQDPATDLPHAKREVIEHSGDTPQEVYDVMAAYIDSALAQERMSDAVAAGRDAACRQVARYD